MTFKEFLYKPWVMWSLILIWVLLLILDSLLAKSLEIPSWAHWAYAISLYLVYGRTINFGEMTEQGIFAHIYQALRWTLFFFIGTRLLGLLAKFLHESIFKFDHAKGFERLHSSSEANTDLTAILLLLIPVLISAASEELLTRRTLIPRLSQYTNIYAAVILSSIIFAISHQLLYWNIPLSVGISQFSIYFFSGILLAIIYLRSKSIAYAITAHFISNSFNKLPDLDGWGSQPENETVFLALKAVILFCGFWIIVTEFFIVSKRIFHDVKKKLNPITSS